MRIAAVSLFLVAVIAVAPAAAAQGSRLPAETVDAFHAALRARNTAAALSQLDRGLVVFEFGSVDPTVEAYAFQHLPFDMDVAAATQWTLLSRRVGGEGDERWVLSTYRVTGRQRDGSPIDMTVLETAILRRTANAFRIVHFHWSTNDPSFQAQAQRQRSPDKR